MERPSTADPGASLAPSMHELSLTRHVVSMVAERAAGRRVTAVKLRIGRLSGVSVEAVRFAFDVCAQGTCAERARLLVTEPEGRGECPACGRSSPMESLVEACASCRMTPLRVVSGEELMIESIEMETG